MKSLCIKNRRVADIIWNSKFYLPSLLIISAAAQITHTQLAAMFLLIGICVFMLVMCDDLLSIACPLLCVSVLSVEFYRDYTVLSPYAVYAAVPFALALLFNVVYYRRPFVKGKLFFPLIAVSAALIVGGIGVIAIDEYFRPVSLYYTFGLGIVMLLLYILFSSRLGNERSYDRTERMADILYVTGLSAALVIALFYIENFDEFIKKGSALFFKPRNFISSVLLMTLPSVCLLIKRHIVHFAGFIFMSAALIFAGSRSGLLFGAMVGALCAVYVVYLLRDRFDLHKWYQVLFIVFAAAVCVLALRYIPVLYSSRIVNGKLISDGETRMAFISRGIKDFVENPLNGVGLGNLRNAEIFKAIIPGSIIFYHNAVVQVFASMGILGAAAYGWLLFVSLKLVIKTVKTTLVVFSIAYIGILAMSMTNPGLFCPFPEAGLTVLLFSLTESNTDVKAVRKEA